MAAETRRVTRQRGLGNPSVFDARGRLRCCRCPREVAGSSFEAACPPSACQLPSPPRLPSKVSWAGGGVGAMLRLSVRRDGGLPAAGTGNVPPVQHWRAGFRSGGCELRPWPFGSSSALPWHLVVAEQQAKIYF